jgi:adenosine deaminase
MTHYPDAFIRAIPKTDLHVHLDGSLRLPTLIELARERRVALPSETEEGLNELVFKPSYRDLDEYLKGFVWSLAVMQDIESLERTAYELALDNWAEGVRYLEVRFAPQLHMSERLAFAGVMTAVDRGLRRARAEVNRGVPDDEPPFDFGIIVCAMRFFTGGFSRYYADLCRTLSFSDPLDVIRTASLELARAAVRLRDETDVQIVGFDLAGSEYGYPADDHLEVYEYVHRNFLRKTVHAGEAPNRSSRPSRSCTPTASATACTSSTRT